MTITSGQDEIEHRDQKNKRKKGNSEITTCKQIKKIYFKENKEPCNKEDKLQSF